MRHDPTPAERRLWQGLRRHRIAALKFRGQVPLGPYIADFYCASAKLVVEVDRVSHIDAPNDAARDAWMAVHNIRVLRISNFDVLTNLEGVLLAIGQVAAPSPPDPLPQGEGECHGSSEAHV